MATTVTAVVDYMPLVVRCGRQCVMHANNVGWFRCQAGCRNAIHSLCCASCDRSQQSWRVDLVALRGARGHGRRAMHDLQLPCLWLLMLLRLLQLLRMHATDCSTGLPAYYPMTDLRVPRRVWTCVATRGAPLDRCLTQLVIGLILPMVTMRHCIYS